jgi:cyclic beta-1,2-glucan synthetase
MDQVGAQGLGESVWLGWFQAALLPRFAALAERRGDTQHAAVYRAHVKRLAEAVEQAWDGEWYRRAYFDDGTPLGSHQNVECRIDSIAQSWAVISGAGRPERATQAMLSVDQHLINSAAQLILLLAPPFDKAPPNPGYISGYVPGVRENGGQYTHAALWVIQAHAMLGHGDRAYELLSFVNPIHRSARPERVEQYRVEPFVVAADIYSAPAHLGRGGWTWYTGAAGWMYRITLEHILGIVREGDSLRINPCVPKGWREFSVVMRLSGSEYRIDVENPEGVNTGVQLLTLDGDAVVDGRIPFQPNAGLRVIRVVLGAHAPAAPG